MSDNPLINVPQQPFNAPPLGYTKPEHIEPAVDLALSKARKDIEDIVNNPDTPTFTNTIHALAFAGEDLGRALTPYGEMTSAINTLDIQGVTDAIRPKLTAYGTEVSLNEDLFKKIKAVYDTEDQNNLSVEEKILLEKTYSGFKNNGALLQGTDRKTYETLSLKLSKLGTDYSNNLVNSAASLKIIIEEKDKHRLDGIPEDIIKTYKANAEKDPAVSNDAYVITMTPPPIDVYEYAKDRTLREEAKRTYDKVGSATPYDNTQNVLDILKARHEMAQLLGFKNHADKTIRPDTRMAENYQTAVDFVEKNKKAYFPVAKKFFKELADFALQKDGITDLKPWDRLYYIRLMREDQIGYNPEEVRDYFELENVLQGLFAHTEKLYGVKLQEADGKYSKMHEDVRTYEVQDAKTGAIKALYFLDPYARDYKKGGAWMSDIRNAGLHDGQQEIPIAGNYCNFTKPDDGDPSLLKDSDVLTLAHELGHACHCMMGAGTYPGLTGINVLWDYVELPSQINEKWAFQPEVLATYANHYDDKSPIPQDLIDKLQKLDVFDARWQGIRQSEMALLDLTLHTTDPATITDLQAFQDQLWDSTELIAWDGPPAALSFGHIFAGGYSAGYYSYKWADALVADVFEQFEEQGLYNPVLCEAFVEKMIEPGGTRPPSVMHEDFMEAVGQGRRGLDPEAMFRQEGLLPKKQNKQVKQKKPGLNP